MTARGAKQLIFFLLIALGIFILKDSTPVSFVVGSIQRALAVPLAAVYTSKAPVENTDSQVQKLRQDNARLTQRLVDFSRLEKDNQVLRAQFEESSIPPKNLLIARIVGATGPATFPSTLVLNQGRASGLKSGMAVVFDEHLVGKIGIVSEHLSKVILVTDPTFSTVGKLAQSDTIGIIKGERDFILFDNVSIKDTIQKESILLTKGDINEHG
jgi:cell shape-determining protein MreC